MGRSPYRTLLCAVLWLAAPGLFAQEASLKVITHVSNPVSSVSREELSRIFLKKASTWSDGKKALPVDQAPGSPTRATFSGAVHGKAAHAVQAYWMQQVFAGRISPPLQLASDAEVIAYVKSNPGSVGYVSAAVSPDGVRVLSVTGSR